MKTLSQLYKEGEGVRSPYLERAKVYSQMTIPAIVPDGDRTNQALEGHFSSVGVEELNHLSNKVANEILPIGKSFFSITTDEETEKEVQDDPEKSNAIREGYNKITIRANKYLAGIKLRSSLVLAEKHLIITGNVALITSDKGVKVMGLGSFVVKRNLLGEVTQAITRESITLSDLPEKTRAEYQREKVKTPMKITGEKEEELSIYTGYFTNEEGVCRVWQELEEVKVTEEVEYEKNNHPALFPRWHTISGEDYGRGYIEDYEDHFTFLQVLESARCLGAVTMLQVYYFKRTGSIIDVPRLNSARNGSWHIGDAADVTALQVGKFNDGTLIVNVISDLRAIIGRAFLMTSSSVRDSERTTAYEIQTLTNDLNTPMSEIYATQEIDIQIPFAYLAISKVAPALFKEGVTPLILTGVEALGKSQDLAKLSKYSEMMLLPASWPEELQNRIDWTAYSTYLEGVIGLSITFFKKEEDVKQQKDSNTNGVANNTFAESMASSAGNEIGKHMGGQTT